MATKEKQSFEILPYNTKVELIAVHKETHKAYKKIIEIQEFKTMKKDTNFDYKLYQIGFSQFKDVVNVAN